MIKTIEIIEIMGGRGRGVKNPYLGKFPKMVPSCGRQCGSTGTDLSGQLLHFTSPILLHFSYHLTPEHFS